MSRAASLMRTPWGRVALNVAAPVGAAAVAFTVTALVLYASGSDPWTAFGSMVDYASQPRTQVLILNTATTYYFSALAVAIGFKMNLFNIGVDGQYRLAAMLAASFGGAVTLPAPFHAIAIILVAMVVGALWAGLAGLLRTTRGVSEVISTIMLNFIATGLVAFLLTPGRLGVAIADSNNVGTPAIPPSGHVGGLNLVPGAPIPVFGLILLAVAAGVGYWFLLNRTRFGFDLRTAGRSEGAAIASGVSVKRMIVASMLLSGAVAGLVGMPQLLGSSHTYSLDFPAGLGFVGIAIALIGRNHPVGIAAGALLWSFLQQSSQILDLGGVPREIVAIMQGVMVLAVVIAYELVRRSRARAVAVDVGRETHTAEPAPTQTGTAS